MSAEMGPLVVCRAKFLRSESEAMPGDGGGGDRERSRMNCPFTGTPRFEMEIVSRGNATPVALILRFQRTKKQKRSELAR